MADRSQGLVADIAAAWGDLRGSIRRQIALNPPESRLLAYVYVAGLIGFIAGLPGAYLHAEGLGEDGSLAGVIAGRLFAAAFVAPLILYGIAALSRLVARCVGGTGSYKSARIAFFWALLVVTPVVILNGLLTAVLGTLGPVQSLAQALGGLIFLWIWSVFITEHEGFSTGLRGIAVVVGLILTILGILLLVRLA